MIYQILKREIKKQFYIYIKKNIKTNFYYKNNYVLITGGFLFGVSAFGVTILT